MSNIIDQARKIIEANGFSESVWISLNSKHAYSHCDLAITLVKGKLEEAELPIQQFDIIISEWMGYFLLYESMLPSVLIARDRYLKPDGILAPSHCQMLLAATTDRGNGILHERERFWNDDPHRPPPAITRSLMVKFCGIHVNSTSGINHGGVRVGFWVMMRMMRKGNLMYII